MSTAPAWTATDPVRLEVRDLHLSFGDNEVLRGVDLEVPSGQSVCVIGPPPR